MALVLGIDLGTTFSVVAAGGDGKPSRVLPNLAGKRLTPSVVAHTPTGRLAGPEAEIYAQGGGEVARLFKRHLADGRQFSLGGELLDAQQLSAELLRYLWRSARLAGAETRQAVISVPAYFGDLERRETREAARDAGLEVLGLINEPTAAALEARIDERIAAGEKFLVYDLGGGTFDVTVGMRTAEAFDVLAVDGNRCLGGHDWDAELAEYLAEKCREATGFDPRGERALADELLAAAEKAKCTLSVAGTVRVEVPTSGRSFSHVLTRKEFELVTRYLVESTETTCRRALQSAGLRWTDVKTIIPVGGSTRLPAVRKLLEQLGGQPLQHGLNPDESVALGAARYAAQLSADAGRDRAAPAAAVCQYRDATAHSLGMVAVSQDGESFVNSIIITKNSCIPSSESRDFKVRTRPGKQSHIEVYVLQGESPRPSACEILRKYRLGPVEHATDGEASVRVEFAYDTNNQVQVSALQPSTGRRLETQEETAEDDLDWLDRHPLLRHPPTPASRRREIVFAIDLSGSMSGGPVWQARQATEKWLATLDLENDSVAVIEFANSAVVTQTATGDKDLLMECFRGWVPGNRGFGNRAHPFDLAPKVFAADASQRTMIVLTDGVWSCEREAIEAAKKCHELGIEIIPLGFGGANKEFLEKIASTPGQARLTQLHSLEESLLQIAREMHRGGQGGQRAGLLVRPSFSR